MEGRVVRPDARNTTKWRNRGIEMTRRIAITRPRGEGLKRACAKSLMPAMIAATIESFRKQNRFVVVLAGAEAEEINARLRMT
jgi:hypothetical protein